MTNTVQIKCINKTDRPNPHERIRNVGGTNTDGTRWRLSLDKAIAGMEADRWKFYVHVGGNSVWVAIATHNGHKYLKTQNDGVQPDNLLSLPECP